MTVLLDTDICIGIMKGRPNLIANLEAIGLKIGPYDVLIAGQAVTHSLKLVTGNIREFSRVLRLDIEDWSV